MRDSGTTVIKEEFYAPTVSPEELDDLLSEGWRHFGEFFFRNNTDTYAAEERRVFPLRIRLADFSLSKSQRRVLRRNADLRIVIGPADVTLEKQDLFERHKRRFKDRIPFSLYDFLSFSPADSPCETREICVYEGRRLIAASFFSLGDASLSGVYAVFEPTETRRSLGIFTMLKEIEFALDTGRHFYYQGYCYDGPSFYDYKKRFRGTEGFNWLGQWRPLAELESE
jgi:arginine-tRNA-protein transferase